MATAPGKTIDLNFHSRIRKGSPLNDPGRPHLLAFEGCIDHVGEFQSMEVSTFRDGLRVSDIGFYSFNHTPEGARTRIKFQYNDEEHCVVEHDYELDATLHYLT